MRFQTSVVNLESAERVQHPLFVFLEAKDDEDKDFYYWTQLHFQGACIELFKQLATKKPLTSSPVFKRYTGLMNLDQQGFSWNKIEGLHSLVDKSAWATFYLVVSLMYIPDIPVEKVLEEFGKFVSSGKTKTSTLSNGDDLSCHFDLLKGMIKFEMKYLCFFSLFINCCQI